MLPDPGLLAEPDDPRILPNGRPAPPLRDDLRRIPSLRNAVSVVSVYVQTLGIIWLAIRLDNPLAWIAAFLLAVGHPWIWPLLWLLPHLTVWRVINRLRSIAEHGGMERSSDRRNTTHSVRQSPWCRFALVPYRIGWHLAHHVDSGIPMHN